jgi:hypothetical protein
MTYQSTTIAKTLPDINRQMFLPAIQREFVWDEEQILRLFDSVVRDYPIGSFLYWNVRGKFAERQVKYKFIEDYITEGNYPSQFNELYHRNQKVNDEFAGLPDKLTLVLDGQQRLTSFYIGLKGSFTDRGHGKMRKKPESWTRKQLYMNLLSNPKVETDDALQMKYEFEFKNEPSVSDGEYWYKVGDILDMDEEDKYDYVDTVLERLEYAGVDQSTINEKYIKQNLDALWDAVHKRPVINFYETEKQDSDRILNVFIRANEGGKQLGKDEVLLSMATAEWSQSDPPIDARQEITNLVDELNGYRDISGFGFDISFILKNLLCVSEQSMAYKIEHFIDGNVLSEMKNTWTDDDFENSLFRTLELIESYGFDGHSVTSSVCLMPIVYFIYKNPRVSLTWDSQEGKHLRKQLFYWLCATLLKSVYSSGTYSKVEAIRGVIKDAPENEFPMMELSQKLYRYSESLAFPEEEVRDQIRTLRSTNKRALVFLSLLYYPAPANEHEQFEIDHIFPRSELKRANLVNNHGFDLEKAERFETLRDNVRNLQLVSRNENRKKSDMPFEEWIESRSDEYFKRHLIPKDPELYSVERFDDFVQARGELIVSRIRTMSEDIESMLGEELEVVEGSTQ